MGGRSEEAGKRRRNAQSCGLALSRVLVLLGRGVGGCHLLCEVRGWARRGIGLRGIRGLGLILSRAGVHALCSAFLYNPRRPIPGPKTEPIRQKNQCMLDMGGETPYEILELSSGLFDDAVLAAENDTHATEVADLGAADDEGINVESSAS